MQIRIKSYTFTISEPFHAGTVITKAEAQALNALRAENIQNNLRAAVAEAIAPLGPDELLGAEALGALRDKFTAYDQGYQFQEKHTPKARLGDIEEEARAIARERIEAEFQRQGQPVPAGDLLDLMIKDQAALPAIEEEARLRVTAKRRVLSEGLDSL